MNVMYACKSVMCYVNQIMSFCLFDNLLEHCYILKNNAAKLQKYK